MADEPTAIRHPKRGKAHRENPRSGGRRPKSRGSRDTDRWWARHVWTYECFLCGLRVTRLTWNQCFTISDNHNQICTQEVVPDAR